jgi:hypothetical protein
MCCEVSGSHGGEYEDGCLLGCCAVMMEAVSTSETLVNFYQTTQRNFPEDSHLQYSSLSCSCINVFTVRALIFKTYFHVLIYTSPSPAIVSAFKPTYESYA